MSSKQRTTRGSGGTFAAAARRAARAEAYKLLDDPGGPEPPRMGEPPADLTLLPPPAPLYPRPQPTPPSPTTHLPPPSETTPTTSFQQTPTRTRRRSSTPGPTPSSKPSGGGVPTPKRGRVGLAAALAAIPSKNHNNHNNNINGYAQQRRSSPGEKKHPKRAVVMAKAESELFRQIRGTLAGMGDKLVETQQHFTTVSDHCKRIRTGQMLRPKKGEDGEMLPLADDEPFQRDQEVQVYDWDLRGVRHSSVQCNMNEDVSLLLEKPMSFHKAVRAFRMVAANKSSINSGASSPAAGPASPGAGVMTPGSLDLTPSVINRALAAEAHHQRLQQQYETLLMENCDPLQTHSLAALEDTVSRRRRQDEAMGLRSLPRSLEGINTGTSTSQVDDDYVLWHLERSRFGDLLRDVKQVIAQGVQKMGEERDEGYAKLWSHLHEPGVPLSRIREECFRSITTYVGRSKGTFRDVIRSVNTFLKRITDRERQLMSLPAVQDKDTQVTLFGANALCNHCIVTTEQPPPTSGLPLGAVVAWRCLDKSTDGDALAASRSTYTDTCLRCGEEYLLNREASIYGVPQSSQSTTGPTTPPARRTRSLRTRKALLAATIRTAMPATASSRSNILLPPDSTPSSPSGRSLSSYNESECSDDSARGDTCTDAPNVSTLLLPLAPTTMSSLSSSIGNSSVGSINSGTPSHVLPSCMGSPRTSDEPTPTNKKRRRRLQP